jgi:hypothetical protein
MENKPRHSSHCGKRAKVCKNMEAATTESAINLPINASTKPVIVRDLDTAVTSI